MTILEILMLIAGFACLCISFFVSNKKQGDETDPGDKGSLVWTEKEEELIANRVKELLDQQQDTALEQAKEQMSHLCNDKIMAIDEFSEQILEKIEKNHQEVVFMYNMLNEKEKDVSQIVQKKILVSKETSASKNNTKESQPAEKKSSAIPVLAGTEDNLNATICKMYDEGMSVLDISRKLNIGQGEAKLILALHGRKES